MIILTMCAVIKEESKINPLLMFVLFSKQIDLIYIEFKLKIFLSYQFLPNYSNFIPCGY